MSGNYSGLPAVMVSLFEDVRRLVRCRPYDEAATLLDHNVTSFECVNVHLSFCVATAACQATATR
jgi:hypothetical protein